MIGGVQPLLPEILDQSDRIGVKSPIFAIFLLIAPDRNTCVKTVSDKVVRHSLA